MTRPVPARVHRLVWALAALPLAMAACSSSPSTPSSSGGSANSSLQGADGTVLHNVSLYESKVAPCQSASSPVVCIEAADRTLGGQVHEYANLLAVGKNFTVSQSDVLNARNNAQTLANSLEILGDAQPTQSNYDQVLNHFNLNGAINQLRRSVNTINAALRG